MTTTTNAMGSGSEVESAAFHPPVGIEQPVGLGAGQSGFRGRLDGLKSRGLGKVHEVQRLLGERTEIVKSSLDAQAGRVQSSMKTSPMLWAGVAAGSGFALGLIGRFIHWRNHHRRVMTPDLVIIDASC